MMECFLEDIERGKLIYNYKPQFMGNRNFGFHGSFNMNSEEYIRLSETASIQSQPVALVSEKEYEYGADAFEIYMKENKGKIKPEMKEVAVQKNEKAR